MQSLTMRDLLVGLLDMDLIEFAFLLLGAYLLKILLIFFIGRVKKILK